MSAFLINPYRFGSGYDSDAQTYIDSVESGDGQSLETAVKDAINTFVLGLKTDGSWSKIKACCILMGARTLTGALKPLVGSAPTNVSSNFVSGDYNRETGLKGDASNKALDSNRANNADPQNDQHMAVYVSELATSNTAAIGAGGSSTTGATHFFNNAAGNAFLHRNRSSSSQSTGSQSYAVGFHGMSRAASGTYTTRANGGNQTWSITSQTPSTETVAVFCRKGGSSYITHTNARIAFYSIGESLTLADLDTRVNTLYNDIAAAIV